MKSPWPDFALRNVFKVLALLRESTEPNLGLGEDSHRAIASQSAPLSRSRIADWARAGGRCLTKKDFADSLNGLQVGSELDAIFRETPSFGRSIARRLQNFHDLMSTGPYQLIGGGGEAVVFFDEESQDVIKLFSVEGKARFGWEIGTDFEGFRTIVPGSLATALIRFARAEQMFPSGLEIDAIGDDGSFLLMRQPFILGENPFRQDLHRWMTGLGWEKFSPVTENRMLAELSWRKDEIFATDVRPENVICAGNDFYSIDFIMGTD